MQPVLLTDKGKEIPGVRKEGKDIPGVAEGILALKGAWPSMLRDLHQNHDRFESTYFEPFKVRSISALSVSHCRQKKRA